jgi:hypothetical protein
VIGDRCDEFLVFDFQKLPGKFSLGSKKTVTKQKEILSNLK